MPACMQPVSLLLLLTILLHINDFAALCSPPAEPACCELQAAGGLHAEWSNRQQRGVAVVVPCADTLTAGLGTATGGVCMLTTPPLLPRAMLPY